VADQVRTPTYVEDLARGIGLLLDKKAEGIFHISGNEVCTPFDMAGMIADEWGLNRGLIEPVNKNSFQQAAQRPLKTGFDIYKARKQLGYEPRSFKSTLKSIHQSWNQSFGQTH
jgi:dTDP-4-dehydrorhamnose reductase